MPEYVWVKDNATGHQFPIREAEAKSAGDAVTVDPHHPTHDPHGELLRPVYHSSVSAEAAKKRGNRAAKSKE